MRRSQGSPSEIVAAAPLFGFLFAACGLSASGEAAAPLDAAPGADASLLDAPTGDAGDAASASDASAPLDAFAGVDAASEGAVDAAVDAVAPCIPFDAGLGGTMALSSFATTGSATFNENGDGRITLTNSQTGQAGAAWSPMPAVSGYDLAWSLRVGPNDTAGDGITFAVVSSSALPGVGDTGDGLGLRNLTGGDGGAVAGYAVDVDMYRNTGDPTDLGTTTLKLVALPAFDVVSSVAVPVALNDGNLYAVEVSWRSPSTLTATLHGPGGTTYQTGSSDPRLTASSAYLGFTAATGSVSDSHNEIAGITVSETCQ